MKNEAETKYVITVHTYPNLLHTGYRDLTFSFDDAYVAAGSTDLVRTLYVAIDTDKISSSTDPEKAQKLANYRLLPNILLPKDSLEKVLMKLGIDQFPVFENAKDARAHLGIDGPGTDAAKPTDKGQAREVVAAAK